MIVVAVSGELGSLPDIELNREIKKSYPEFGDLTLGDQLGRNDQRSRVAARSAPMTTSGPGRDRIPGRPPAQDRLKAPVVDLVPNDVSNFVYFISLVIFDRLRRYSTFYYIDPF